MFDDDDNALGDDGEIVELPIVEEPKKKHKKETVVEESDDDDAPEVQTKAGASSVAKELAMKEKEAIRVQQEKEKAKRREKEDLRQERAKEVKALKEAQAALEAQKKAEEDIEEEDEDEDLPEEVLKAVAAHHDKVNNESKAVLAFNRQQEIVQRRRAKLKGERPVHTNSKVADYEVKK